MKISRDWLSDFIDWIETDPAVIADRLTRGVGEVDEVEMQGALLVGCVVGRVQSVEKHPNADKLSVCIVQTEAGAKTVVCGGTNVRPEMLVAFAHTGATVKWHGGETMTLAPVKIRGIESHGMICAQEELGLTQFPPKPEDGERPIVDLTDLGCTPGTPLRQALGLTDVIFHIDNHAITNRPDLFSQIGVARELVAMGVATWKKEPKIPTIKFPTAPAPFTLHNDVPDLVPYYEGAFLHVDASGPSPDWMQRRLAATGWRPINLMVDVTNYVLMEIGMPLHAFDADDFRGELRIRTSKNGEKITTLDKATRELPEGALVISDDAGIFDLFGVMGGLRTSQKPTTRSVFLQAGIVDPVSVRRTVIAMGHRTDAATVYEKGVMPITAALGLRRAIELLMAHAKDCRVTSKLITWGKAPAQKPVKTDLVKILGCIGAPIDAKRVKKILTDLGCTVKGTGTALSIAPPAWRRDITHVQDIAEEVARTYGYANVKPEMPDASITPPVRDHRIDSIRDGLKEERCTELLHLAFTSPAVLQKAGLDPTTSVQIENPIGEELSRMRPSLLPSLLETAGRAMVNYAGTILSVFEYGHIFAPGSERAELILLSVAKGKTSLKDNPLLITKASLIHAMKQTGYDLTFTQTTTHLPAYAHGGRSASILCQGTVIGLLTEISPSIRLAFDLQYRSAAAIIDLDALLALEPTILISSALPAFPAVIFDETITMPQTTFATITEKLLAINPLLRSIAVVDLYEGEENKTITLRFTYRADDRTLTQEEVEKIHAKILVELKQ